MAHWLAALAILVEDLNLVRSIHMASSQLPIILCLLLTSMDT